MGVCTKLRPWSNWLIAANFVVPRFFSRESCFAAFEGFQSNFEGIFVFGCSIFGRFVFTPKVKSGFIRKAFKSFGIANALSDLQDDAVWDDDTEEAEGEENVIDNEFETKSEGKSGD